MDEWSGVVILLVIGALFTVVALVRSAFARRPADADPGRPLPQGRSARARLFLKQEPALSGEIGGARGEHP